MKQQFEAYFNFTGRQLKRLRDELENFRRLPTPPDEFPILSKLYEATVELVAQAAKYEALNGDA